MNPIITVLATRRLTQMIVEDEITAPIRTRIEKWADQYEYGTPQERVAYLVGCGACTSIWAGGLVLLARRWRLGRFGLGVLAASQAALIVEAVVGRLER